MKRIIDGKTYNSETATRVAIAEEAKRDAPFRRATLYLSRDGKFFVCYEGVRFAGEALCLVDTNAEIEAFNDDIRGHEWQVYDPDAWRDICHLAAGKALRRRRSESGRQRVNTQLRLTRSLKDRLDAAAKSAGMSTNAFILRTLENTLAEKVN